ncbi:ankyrin repeat domain-containing protein 34C [Embiotoca jacksoni]|uniref:ankyrin repeat domain-containing protein 34C n=1 Tax=Embiotoca jacksoni TaxID=100190 RepID=UPI003704C978
MGDPLSDCSPLISAASSGKLRLVRLLVEGGAQVNGRNPRGETALLAACKALRGEPSGPEMVKLLTYLLHNKADPNAQDRAGRTALMYACMERAGAQVASTLLAAGGDPGMEDYSGASALVYAINAQHQPTLKVLMDACQAGGRDIIIIATEMGVNGGPVTRRYLNVPPSPDTSPVSCMSPSDIVLKTGPPNSPEGENFFNFRGTSKRGSNSCRKHPSSELRPLSQCSTPPPRQRISSEPRHAIHDLACLNRAYEEGMREGGLREVGDGQDLRRERGRREDEEGEDEDEASHFHPSRMEKRRESLVQRGESRCGGENCCHEGFSLRASQSVLSLIEMNSSHAQSSSIALRRCPTPGGSTSDLKLPPCTSPRSQLRRNTLPSVTVVPPLLHLPPLAIQSDSHLQVAAQVSPSKRRTAVFLPHPPSSFPRPTFSEASARPAVLPPLPLASSVTSPVAPSASCYGERGRRPQRRHSVQLEQIRGEHR